MMTSTGQTPSYYTASNGKEVMDYIMEYELGFLRGNALKYITRAEQKGTYEKDLFKAYDYLLYYQQLFESSTQTLETFAATKLPFKSEEYVKLKTDVLYENIFNIENFSLRVVALDILSGYIDAGIILLKHEIN